MPLPRVCEGQERQVHSSGGYAKTQTEKKQQFSIMEDNVYELFPHLKNRDSLLFHMILVGIK